MTSRFALSIAPILMFALSHQAHADTTVEKPTAHQSPSRLAISRHTKNRTAMLAARHGRHISFRHLAIRHVEGRHVAYSSSAASLTDGDGWNPIAAGVSSPKPSKLVGSAASLTDSDGWNPIAAGVSSPKPSKLVGSAASLTDGDGWNPADAGVSSPKPSKLVGASVHLTSFEAPVSSDEMIADSQTGIASYYGGRHNGRRTSSGAIFNEHQMTAAHSSLPFGTKVLVQLEGTDRSVVVMITDRLFSRHRIIDLSEGAAERLGIIRAGTALVMLTPQN
jgi:rare lipoprotein A